LPPRDQVAAQHQRKAAQQPQSGEEHTACNIASAAHQSNPQQHACEHEGLALRPAEVVRQRSESERRQAKEERGPAMQLRCGTEQQI